MSQNVLSPDKAQYRTGQWKQGSVSILILSACMEDLPFCIRVYFKQISDLAMLCAMLLDVKLAPSLNFLSLNYTRNYLIMNEIVMICHLWVDLKRIKGG